MFKKVVTTTLAAGLLASSVLVAGCNKQAANQPTAQPAQPAQPSQPSGGQSTTGGGGQ